MSAQSQEKAQFMARPTFRASDQTWYEILTALYGALTLCRVGLPSTCRAVKKQQSPERWVLSELVPGRKKKFIKLIFSPFRCHLLAVSIPGPYRVSNVCTGFVAATYQSLSVPSPLGASCDRVPGLLTS